MSERWIVIPNWNDFQHYRNRDPKWIKTYTELLHKDEYLRLTGHQRGVLHGIWLEYASCGCQLRLDTASLSRQLGLRVTSHTIETLAYAGFIEVVASKPLAQRYPRGRGREREELAFTSIEDPENNRPTFDIANILKEIR